MPENNDSSAEPDYFSQQVVEARRFYLESESKLRGRLEIISGGFEKCSPDYLIDRCSFPYLTLEFVLRGHGWLVMDSRRTELERGVIFTYGPGVAHQMTADPEDPPEKYFIDFRGREALRLMSACKLQPGTRQRILAPTDIAAILDDLIIDGSRGGPIAGKLCGALLEYLLYRIVVAVDRSHEMHTPAYSTYEMCREYIDQEYLRLQSTKDVSEETGVNQAYLCRLFQRYDEQTPHQLLTRLKMKKAAELLHDRRLLIKQIAKAVGYTDPFHFSRTFKSSYGVSPQSFRQYRC